MQVSAVAWSDGDHAGPSAPVPDVPNDPPGDEQRPTPVTSGAADQDIVDKDGQRMRIVRAITLSGDMKDNGVKSTQWTDKFWCVL